MLSLTKKSEYALIAICHLARVGDRIVSAREIAEQHEVPLPLLMNVLKKLGQTGHVRSVRGARGGYTLALPPGELSLATLIEAVEGPVRLVNCVPGPGGPRRACVRTNVCSIRWPVHKVHDRLLRFLGGISVADVAFDGDYREVKNSREVGRTVAK